MVFKKEDNDRLFSTRQVKDFGKIILAIGIIQSVRNDIKQLFRPPPPMSRFVTINQFPLPPPLRNDFSEK